MQEGLDPQNNVLNNVQSDTNSPTELPKESAVPPINPTPSQNIFKRPLKLLISKSTWRAILQIFLFSLLSGIILVAIFDWQLVHTPDLEMEGLILFMPFITIPYFAAIVFSCLIVPFLLTRLIPWKYAHLIYSPLVFIAVIVRLSPISNKIDISSINDSVLSLIIMILTTICGFSIQYFWITRLRKTQSENLVENYQQTFKKSIIASALTYTVIAIAFFFLPLTQNIKAQKTQRAELVNQVSLINTDLMKLALPSTCDISGVHQSVEEGYKSGDITCKMNILLGNKEKSSPLIWKGRFEIGLLPDNPLIKDNDNVKFKYSGSTIKYIRNDAKGPFEDDKLSDGVDIKIFTYTELKMYLKELYWQKDSYVYWLRGGFENGNNGTFGEEVANAYDLTEFTKAIALRIQDYDNPQKYNNDNLVSVSEKLVGWAVDQKPPAENSEKIIPAKTESNLSANGYIAEFNFFVNNSTDIYGLGGSYVNDICITQTPTSISNAGTQYIISPSTTFSINGTVVNRTFISMTEIETKYQKVKVEYQKVVGENRAFYIATNVAFY